MEIYGREFDKLADLEARPDFPALERFAVILYAEWNQQGKEKDLRSLMLANVVSALGSTGVGAPQKLCDLARQYGAELLSRPDDLLECCEVQIIAQVPWDRAASMEEPRSIAEFKERETIAASFFRADRRLLSARLAASVRAD